MRSNLDISAYVYLGIDMCKCTYYRMLANTSKCLYRSGTGDLGIRV
ncbi:MAG: hypothetical protein R2794_04450 [Chitinophagales bacterium]